MTIKITVRDLKTGEETEVQNFMYFFEEEGINNIETGQGLYSKFLIKITKDGVVVYCNDADLQRE